MRTCVLVTLALMALPPGVAAQCQASRQNRESFEPQARVDCAALGQACNIADLNSDRTVTAEGVLSSNDDCTVTVLPLDSASDGTNRCSVRVDAGGALTRSTRGGWPPSGAVNATGIQASAEPLTERFLRNCAAWCGDAPYDTESDEWWQQPGLFTCYGYSRCSRSLCLPDAQQRATLRPSADQAPTAAPTGSAGSGQAPPGNAEPEPGVSLPQPPRAPTPAQIPRSAVPTNRTSAQAPVAPVMPSSLPAPAPVSIRAAQPSDPATAAASAADPAAAPAASVGARAASAAQVSEERYRRHVGIAAGVASACALLLVVLSSAGLALCCRKRRDQRMLATTLAMPLQRGKGDDDSSNAQCKSDALVSRCAAADTNPRAASLSRAHATAASTSRGYTDSPHSSLLPRRTPETDDAHARLVAALQNFAAAEPPQLFAGKYLLLQERVVGGQAMVNFARVPGGSIDSYAIKCDSYSICMRGVSCAGTPVSCPDLATASLNAYTGF